MIQLGIDRISEYRDIFYGKQIGLITNFSGISSKLREDLDEFEAAGYKVVKLFTPEHGLYGEFDGKAVDSSLHPKYKIPMISLYGEKLAPSAEDLSGVDILVYDTQDVGLRYYTYIYTMVNCMKSACEQGIEFAVLDRPNPLGDKVSGVCIKPEFDSFVGGYGLPIRYGMTPGEIGQYFVDYLGLSLKYTVVRMDGYRDEFIWPQTGQLWNLPSPSIHNFETNICYNGGCFFEATNISEGRGTGRPFQIFGAPFVRLDEFVGELKNRLSLLNLANDISVRPRAFTPFWSKHQGKTCFGVEFLPTSDYADFQLVGLVTMKVFRDLYPEEFSFASYADVSRLSSLVGDEIGERYVAGEVTFAELKECFEDSAAVFEKKTKVYRMY